MAKESVLTQPQKDSIQIKKFIFHIIIESELNPVFLDEIELTPSQLDFFRQRFIDAAEGTQFEFNDKTTSDVFIRCEKIVNDPDQFHEMSKFLTASFKTHHKKKTTSDGVFITSLVSIEDKADIIFLLKIDNKKVYEYKKLGEKYIMEEIKNTFSEDKKAIQKIAIVDVGNYFVWDVLASDRYPTPGKAIRDFFANFLAVHERETPSVLTSKTISAIRKWAVANKAELDPEQETATYKNRCVEYLKNTPKVKFNDLINRVVSDQDNNRKSRLKKSLKSYLEEQGLYGQSFKPSQGFINKTETKHIRKTAEGIKIEWEGETADVNIEIPNTPNPNDGLYHIVIKTTEVEVIR
jgi:hypothetical protein